MTRTNGLVQNARSLLSKSYTNNSNGCRLLLQYNVSAVLKVGVVEKRCCRKKYTRLSLSSWRQRVLKIRMVSVLSAGHRCCCMVRNLEKVEEVDAHVAEGG